MGETWLQPVTLKQGNDMSSEYRLSVNARRELQEYMVNAGAWVCCMNCEYWQHQHNGNQCGQFNTVPPPHIIINGCNKYEVKIPF